MNTIRRLTKDDLPRLREFWLGNWGGEDMIVHGEIILYDQLQGFICGNWVGLLTYIVRGDECEIISLNSLKEDKGIGSALIHEIIHEVNKKKYRRLSLITTNDNLRALGFYQKRGFQLAALHRGAVDKARKIKPNIPVIGENNIPLRDEIELEILF